MYLTKEQKNRYKILSRKACERYCAQTHKETSVIISIRSTWDKEEPKIYADDKNRVLAVLPLSFDDVEREDDERYCREHNNTFAMSKQDGCNIADFVNLWYDKTDRIIVHCDGGVSRSAGVAAAIMRVKEGDDFPVFDNRNKHPNMTCYLRTLKGFKYI